MLIASSIASIELWVIFNLAVVGLLIFDLCLHKNDHVIGTREAVGWTCFWITASLLFNFYLYFAFDDKVAIEFLTGFLVEKSLSVDNLFVFILVFDYFQTPKTALHKVLFWGILGAIVSRAAFIFLGVTLINRFHWLIYVFGAFLIITAIKLALEKDKKVEPEKNIVLRLFRKCFTTTDKYHKDRFWIVQAGKRVATPLFAVLVVIEATDIIFAIDSIPAILAITKDPFIVYSSNICAILGLRSLFFVLAKVMGAFHLLHYGLAAILLFIGTKMVISEWIPIPTMTSLLVVFVLLASSITLSIFFPERKR